MNDIQFTRLEAVLNAYGEDVATRYRQKLDEAGKNATSALRDTLRPYVERDGDIYTVYLALQDYWKYLERGTRMQGPYRQQGKFPPLAPILAWVQAKPVIPYMGSNGKIPTQRQLAFLIARKIWRDGTRPFWFLRDSLAEAGDIQERVEAAIHEDIAQWIKDLIDSIR